MRPDKYALAAAGLFYKNEGDVCECFSCGVRLSQWDLSDDALAEHKKWSKDCRFLKMIGYGERRTDDDRSLFGAFTQSSNNERRTHNNQPTFGTLNQCAQGLTFPW